MVETGLALRYFITFACHGAHLHGRFVVPTQFRLKFSRWREDLRFMHWDIVEVVPKADYSLFVRFKDGLEGTVCLRPDQLTGVLEPLRNQSLR